MKKNMTKRNSGQILFNEKQNVFRFEQAYISSVLATEKGPHWIGLYNTGSSDFSYKWTTQKPLAYTNWYRDFTGILVLISNLPKSQELWSGFILQNCLPLNCWV